jgi:hypothetical protein
MVIMNKDIINKMNSLGNSKFRGSFHLNAKMKLYVKEKGLDDVGFEYYKDFGMTDKSLEEAEKILSESQDSYYDIHNGVPYGWDYISDMRGFDGVRPEQFEMVQNTNNTGAHLYNIASKKKD